MQRHKERLQKGLEKEAKTLHQFRLEASIIMNRGVFSPDKAFNVPEFTDVFNPETRKNEQRLVTDVMENILQGEIEHEKQLLTAYEKELADRTKAGTLDEKETQILRDLIQEKQEAVENLPVQLPIAIQQEKDAIAAFKEFSPEFVNALTQSKEMTMKTLGQIPQDELFDLANTHENITKARLSRRKEMGLSEEGEHKKQDGNEKIVKLSKDGAGKVYKTFHHHDASTAPRPIPPIYEQQTGILMANHYHMEKTGDAKNPFLIKFSAGCEQSPARTIQQVVLNNGLVKEFMPTKIQHYQNELYMVQPTNKTFDPNNSDHVKKVKEFDKHSVAGCGEDDRMMLLNTSEGVIPAAWGDARWRNATFDPKTGNMAYVDGVICIPEKAALSKEQQKTMDEYVQHQRNSGLEPVKCRSEVEPAWAMARKASREAFQKNQETHEKLFSKSKFPSRDSEAAQLENAYAPVKFHFGFNERDGLVTKTQNQRVADFQRR